MKRLGIMILTLVIFAMPLTAFADGWSDIPMKYMTDNGYFQDGDPSAVMTRLDVAKVLAKLPLIDKGSNYVFTDACDAAMVKVAKAGLMGGYGDQTFRPDDPMSREEAAKVAATMLSDSQSDDALTFSDSGDVADWAVPYVAALVNEGIVVGNGDNTFLPQNGVTRAELASMFMKIRNKYTVTDITGNISNNATVTPVQYLYIPAGFVGFLTIPAIGITDMPVVEDCETIDNIKTNPGHFLNTSLFTGNVCLCGHDFTTKSPWFGKLADLNTGDEIIWETKYGIRHYSVTVNQDIDAEDWSALQPTDNNRISLLTCKMGASDTTRILLQGSEK